MRGQLELLYSVQTIDTNIKKSEALQKKYQKDIVGLEEEAKKEEHNLARQQELLSQTEKKHRDGERDLKALEEQKQKLEDRLLSIKTNKEYQASLHEVESIKQSISTKEGGIIELMDDVEAAKHGVKSAEDDLKKIKDRYDEQKRRIEGELQTYLADIEQQKAQREEVVREIKPDLFADFTRIQKMRHGRAVALTDNELCLGCNMKIPPQMYNEVVYGEKIITCPHCSRILFVERDNGAQSGEA